MYVIAHFSDGDITACQSLGVPCGFVSHSFPFSFQYNTARRLSSAPAATAARAAAHLLPRLLHPVGRPQPRAHEQEDLHWAEAQLDLADVRDPAPPVLRERVVDLPEKQMFCCFVRTEKETRLGARRCAS